MTNTPSSSVSPSITPSSSITPSVTSTPSITPSISITPSSSPFVPAECINFQVTGNTWSDVYYFFGYGSITFDGISDVEITCGGSKSIYTAYSPSQGLRIISYDELLGDYVVTVWPATSISCGDKKDVTTISTQGTISYSTYNGFEYPTTGLITGETYTYEATNTVCPSPSTTPSVTPSNTPSSSVSATPSVTPSISLSITPSISMSATPSITPSLTPSTTPSGIYPKMNLSGSTGWSSTWTGDYSYYGIGYTQPILDNYRTGTAPNGKNYAVYTKDSDPDNIVMIMSFDISNNRLTFQLWNATDKTSVGWTDGESLVPGNGVADFEWEELINECSTGGVYHLCAKTYNNNNPTPSPAQNIISYSY